MLVLSRKLGEEILIGNDIVVKVVRVQGDKVRIGISAPPRTAVHRREVYEEMKREAESRGVPLESIEGFHRYR